MRESVSYHETMGCVCVEHKIKCPSITWKKQIHFYEIQQG